jgi:hypothetical protein
MGVDLERLEAAAVALEATIEADAVREAIAEIRELRALRHRSKLDPSDILHAVGEETLSTAEIVARVTASHGSVSNMLRAMRLRGEMEQPRYGHWRVTGGAGDGAREEEDPCHVHVPGFAEFADAPDRFKDDLGGSGIDYSPPEG